MPKPKSTAAPSQPPQSPAAYRADPLAFALDLRILAGGRAVRFGNVIAEFQRERFAALAPALLAVSHGRRPAIGRYWWEATKGASKDSDLAIALLWLLLFTPRPIDGQIAAADRDQASEVRKAARDLLHCNTWLRRWLQVDAWRVLNTETGSVAEIVASDVTGSHGARPDFLLVNELSHVTKREFVENLADNATKVPHGLWVVATNAGFVGTWQFRWRENARTSGRWSFHKYDLPAPWLPTEDIDEARRRNTPTRYNRLWRGVWESGVGDAIDPADVEAAIDRGLGPAGSVDQWTVAGGAIDLGIKQDHSALVVLGASSQTKRARLLYCQSWKPGVEGKVDLQAVEDAVYDAHVRYRLRWCRYDPFQAQHLAQRLVKRGVKMIEVPFVGKNQNAMATAMLDTFRSRLLDLYEDHDLVADLYRLTIVEKPYGYKLESYRDEDGHADRAFALAMTLLGYQDLLNASPREMPWDGFVRGKMADVRPGSFRGW